MHTTTTLLLHVTPLAVSLALTVGCSGEAAAGKDDASDSPAASAPETKPAAAGSASIRVEVSGLRSADGAMRAYLYSSGEGFPVEFSKADARAKSTALAGGKATLRFEGLAPGEYAVFVFHDENGDGKLEKNLLGMPKEGIGLSKVKLDRPKRPKFSAAKFQVSGPTTQRISLRYM